jgi:chemotaxis protein MotB
MMRKKRQGRVSHDRWLVSYADFITLLFAFFVVLFATGQSDKRKKIELATSIQSAFSQMGIFEAHSKSPPLINASGAGGADESAVQLPLTSPVLATPESMLFVRQQLEQAAQSEIDRGVIGLHESSNGLVISLQEAGFFDSGAAGIRPSALPVLDRIAGVLPESPLRVEGHTDDVPIHTPLFASNWELSSSRASSIARLLLLHPNVHAEQMSVAGYAEFHPAASNATAAGRARNRRVDIVLLSGPN